MESAQFPVRVLKIVGVVGDVLTDNSQRVVQNRRSTAHRPARHVWLPLCPERRDPLHDSLVRAVSPGRNSPARDDHVTSRALQALVVEERSARCLAAVRRLATPCGRVCTADSRSVRRTRESAPARAGPQSRRIRQLAASRWAARRRRTIASLRLRGPPPGAHCRFLFAMQRSRHLSAFSRCCAGILIASGCREEGGRIESCRYYD